MSERGRHRMQFCVRLEKFAHVARTKRERGRLRRMIFTLTMTHRLCIRAGPSTLEAGRVTTLTTTLLPPVHCRSSILAAEKRLALLATGRTRRARRSDLLPSSVVTRDFFPLPSSPSIIPCPGKILLQRLANAKRQVSRDSPESCSNADGRARRGPHEFPPLRAPQTPHRRLCQVRSGVNSGF